MGYVCQHHKSIVDMKSPGNSDIVWIRTQKLCYKCLGQIEQFALGGTYTGTKSAARRFLCRIVSRSNRINATDWFARILVW